MTSVVILAGGKGERLWPKSRSRTPKQMVGITGENSMLKVTIERFLPLAHKSSIFIVTCKEYEDIVRQQAEGVPSQNIIVEPESRNTAACIGLASIYLKRNDPDALMIVSPCDHYIEDSGYLNMLLGTCVKTASSNECIVTLGIKPERAETGYGYIEYSPEKYSVCQEQILYKVISFHEKPDFKTAAEYVENPNFLWNSGIYVMMASMYINCLKKFMPGLYEGLQKINNAIGTSREAEVLNREYFNFANVSIDKGVVEKAKNIYVAPANIRWSDLGSWTSLETIFESDRDKNIFKGIVVSKNASNCIVNSTGSDSTGRLVALLGVKDIILVETEDVIFVCSRDMAQETGKILNILKEKGLEKYL